jgi:hypothetical protein
MRKQKAGRDPSHGAEFGDEPLRLKDFCPTANAQRTELYFIISKIYWEAYFYFNGRNW